jgi:hypothetical protein
MRTSTKIPPATFEVMKNTQINIVREMGLVMQRASFSVVFSEGLYTVPGETCSPRQRTYPPTSVCRGS